MRKVFLNMTMTLDGYFCGPSGELDWMSQAPDQEQSDDIVDFFQGVDQGFINPRRKTLGFSRRDTRRVPLGPVGNGGVRVSASLRQKQNASL